jgi:hypothetical protein
MSILRTIKQIRQGERGPFRLWGSSQERSRRAVTRLSVKVRSLLGFFLGSLQVTDVTQLTWTEDDGVGAKGQAGGVGALGVVNSRFPSYVEQDE